MKGKMFLILLAVAAVVIGSVHGDEEQPPMYAVHDFASGELQKLRNVNVGENCDGEFATKLEAIVTDMENNKEGTADMAASLRNQFTELVDQNKEKNLCVKNSWCVSGVCKNRAVQQGRAAGGAPPKPAGAVPAAGAETTKPPPPTTVAGGNPTEAAPAAPTTADTSSGISSRINYLLFLTAFAAAFLATN